jgi:hypothetical protein
VKALTLTQPWATLVAIGAKQIETRSWSTRYRGPLAIHAAKGFPRAAHDLCYTEPFITALELAKIGPGVLPRGLVVATCQLTNVVRVEPGRLYATERERAFGDYTIGRYAWLLDEVEPLPEPMPARGALGLWEWTP